MGRIAIASTGLGRIHRGFESFAENLFRVLSPNTDVVLLKGGGIATANQRVIPNLPRRRSLMLGLAKNEEHAYRLEQQSFAVGALGTLVRERVSVVHYQDPALTGVWARLRDWLGMRLVLVFGNGGALTPGHFSRADLVQVLTREQWQEARDAGIPAERLFLIPHGIDCTSIAVSPSYVRSVGRAALGWPRDRWIVLAVAALARSDKRIDWLIRELAEGGHGDEFLVVAGQAGSDTPWLRALAAELLPGRHLLTTLPPERVRELYWAADVAVLPSLREGFGLAAFESAAAGTPVLVHDGPHFRGFGLHEGSYVDMGKRGALGDRLRMMRERDAERGEVSKSNRLWVEEHLDWSRLVDQYRELYFAAGRRVGN